MSFEKAFVNQFLRIILSPRYWEFSPIKLGKTFFHIFSNLAQKTQSENHCKLFNSVLRTPTKFVLFSNQKVRKYFHLCQATAFITKQVKSDRIRLRRKMYFTEHTFQINVKYTYINLVLQKLVPTCISIFGFFSSSRP